MDREFLDTGQWNLTLCHGRADGLLICASQRYRDIGSRCESTNILTSGLGASFIRSLAPIAADAKLTDIGNAPMALQQAHFSADKKSIEVAVRPRKGSAVVCSRCHLPASGYDGILHHAPSKRATFRGNVILT